MKKLNYSLLHIPTEVLQDQILSYFEYHWILNTARLVCKEWNSFHKNVQTNYFKVKLNRSDLKQLEIIMKYHSDELSKVTNLYFYTFRNTPNDVIELDKEFIIKLTNLKVLELSSENESHFVEFSKLNTLENVSIYGYSNEKQLSQFFKCKSSIKSFKIRSGYKHKIQFDMDWPLEMLDISGFYGSSFMSILESKFAKNLQTLHVEKSLSMDNTDDFITNLSSLTRLSFRPTSAYMLVPASRIETLKELHCNYITFGNEALTYISKLKNLESLILEGGEERGRIENEGLHHICSLSLLKYLDLSNNQIGDEGVKSLCMLNELVSVKLRNNRVNGIGANYLSLIINITYLDLSKNSIDSDGLRNFGKLQSLTHLEIQSNNIGGGFKYLGDCQVLEYINVSDNDITDEHVIEFCMKSPKVKELFISENKNVTDQCCESIAEKLDHLTHLDISNIDILDKGFSTLGLIRNLTWLEANNCAIDDLGLVEFFKYYSKIHSPTNQLILSLESNLITNKISIQSNKEYISKVQISEEYISDENIIDVNSTKKKQRPCFLH